MSDSTTPKNDQEVEKALLKGLQTHNWIEVNTSIVGGSPGRPKVAAPPQDSIDVCPACSICDTCGLKACTFAGGLGKENFTNCPKDCEIETVGVVDRGVINAIKTRIRYLEEIGHSKKTS